MRVALLTNILTPYRRFFFDRLCDELDSRGSTLRVFVMSETEPNRPWKYSSLKTHYTQLLECRSFNVGGAFLHFNNGLMREIGDYKPSVLICAGSYLEPSVLKLVQNKSSLEMPLVFWSESHLDESKGTSGIKRVIREGLRKYVYPKFDGFWVAGELSLQLVKAYVDRPNALLVPNLVNPSLFQAPKTDTERTLTRQSLGIKNDAKVLFTPARLDPVKGLVEFIKLLAKTKGPQNIEYLIAGEGELGECIEALVKELPISVRLLGQRSEDEMADLYSLSDFFVLPSLSDPNPLSCVEACWSSKPLLVSNHVGNYPELIRPGENGWVFSYENEAEAVNIVNGALSSTERWRRNAGRCSLGIVEEAYCPETVCKRIADWLECLCEREGR